MHHTTDCESMAIVMVAAPGSWLKTVIPAVVDGSYT
jgi:hypothetical protein